jgi:hypothetical protein
MLLPPCSLQQPGNIVLLPPCSLRQPGNIMLLPPCSLQQPGNIVLLPRCSLQQPGNMPKQSQFTHFQDKPPREIEVCKTNGANASRKKEGVSVLKYRAKKQKPFLQLKNEDL